MKCPVCDSVSTRPSYDLPWARLWQCGICGCFFDERSDCEATNQTHFQSDDSEIDAQNALRWAQAHFSYIPRYTRAEGRLLEFGFGSGEFLRCAAEAGFQAVGVDPFSVLRKSNEHVRVQVVHQDMRAFRDPRLFDVAAAFHLIEHFPDPYPVLNAIHANLKPGGLFVFEVPHAGSLEHFVLRKKWGFYEYHYVHYTLRGIRELMQRAGFRIIHLETVGSSLQLLAYQAAFKLSRILKLPEPRLFQKSHAWEQALSILEGKLGWGPNAACVAVKI